MGILHTCHTRDRRANFVGQFACSPQWTRHAISPCTGASSVLLIVPTSATRDTLFQPHPPILAFRGAANAMNFARLLRRAGLPRGSVEAIAAQDALTRIDLASKSLTWSVIEIFIFIFEGLLFFSNGGVSRQRHC